MTFQFDIDNNKMNRKRKYYENEKTQNDEEKLKLAVRIGDETAVKRLVKGGVIVNNMKLMFGGTILHDAVASGKLPIIKLLLQAKADVNSTNIDRRTCLHVASRMGFSGNLDIVKELLKHGAKVNMQTKDKRTALHFATWRGNTEIVQQLVDHGADVNMKDEDNWSPLYWAAKLNYQEMAKILVKNGACLNCVNKVGMTPLHEVLKNGHVGLAKYLIAEGAKVTGNTKGTFQFMVDNKDITEDRISLCDTFIEAGFPIGTNRPLKNVLSRKPNIDQSFVKHIQIRQQEVLSLKWLCRICVRTAMIDSNGGCSISGKVTELPLPKLLQDFLVMFSS